MSDLLGLLTEAERELVTKARNSLNWYDRWGSWAMVCLNFLSAAICLGISSLILFVVLRLELVAPQQGFLWGLAVGVGIGAVAGYFLMQGLRHVMAAILYSREMQETRLLVKLHDALSRVMERTEFAVSHEQ